MSLPIYDVNIICTGLYVQDNTCHHHEISIRGLHDHFLCILTYLIKNVYIYVSAHDAFLTV